MPAGPELAASAGRPREGPPNFHNAPQIPGALCPAPVWRSGQGLPEDGHLSLPLSFTHSTAVAGTTKSAHLKISRYRKSRSGPDTAMRQRRRCGASPWTWTPAGRQTLRARQPRPRLLPTHGLPLGHHPPSPTMRSGWAAHPLTRGSHPTPMTVTQGTSRWRHRGGALSGLLLARGNKRHSFCR